MNRLFLTENPLPAGRYVVCMWALAFFPSIVLGLLLFCLLGECSEGFMEPRGAPWPVFFLLIVVVSPVIETLLMVLIFWILEQFLSKEVHLAIGSAVVWGVVHSLLEPRWGFVICWPFFVFSCAYLTWRRQSRTKAFLVTSSIHALQNAIPGLLMVLAMVA